MITRSKPKGMGIDQLISMLLAAKEQGATHAYVSTRTSTRGDGECCGIDFVSMKPASGIAYIGALDPKDKWEHMSNEALESLDW